MTDQEKIAAWLKQMDGVPDKLHHKKRRQDRKEYYRQWYQDHREQHDKKSLEWYHKNKESYNPVRYARRAAAKEEE